MLNINIIILLLFQFCVSHLVSLSSPPYTIDFLLNPSPHGWIPLDLFSYISVINNLFLKTAKQLPYPDLCSTSLWNSHLQPICHWPLLMPIFYSQTLAFLKYLSNCWNLFWSTVMFWKVYLMLHYWLCCICQLSPSSESFHKGINSE